MFYPNFGFTSRYITDACKDGTKTFTENQDSKHHLLDQSWHIYRVHTTFFRNKTFLFFKIDS